MKQIKNKHLVRGEDDYIYSSSDVVPNNEYPNEFRLIPKLWKEEYNKCKDNPYYFATKYLKIDNKPFTTHLNEEQFNSIIKKYEEFNK